MRHFEKVLSRLLGLWQKYIDTITAEWREQANRRSLLIIVFVGTLSIFIYTNVFAPPQDFPVGELVPVAEGSSARAVGTALEAAGVVQSGTALSIAVTLFGSDRGIRAGDYVFKEPRGLFAIAKAITTGAFGLEPIRIRIPEGATTKDMARIYSKQLVRFDEEAFLEAAQPDEGFLFPDTYFFLPNADDEIVLKAMRQNFDTNIATLAGEIEAFGKPLREVVILASILEKEAHVFQDRRMIAGVLWRRLKINMPLQVDAAFLYTLGRTTFDLTMKDLTSDDPYNTYKNKGLPPGAIGSPSLASLRAAVTPIDKGYIFYLADSNHVTHYSKTYEEHLRLKALYLGT